MAVSLKFMPKVGYRMSTHQAKYFFADEFNRDVPTSAQLYVRRRHDLHFYRVIGLRRDRDTGGILGETFDFQFIPLNDDDYLCVEVRL